MTIFMIGFFAFIAWIVYSASAQRDRANQFWRDVASQLRFTEVQGSLLKSPAVIGTIDGVGIRIANHTPSRGTNFTRFEATDPLHRMPISLEEGPHAG